MIVGTRPCGHSDRRYTQFVADQVALFAGRLCRPQTLFGTVAESQAGWAWPLRLPWRVLAHPGQPRGLGVLQWVEPVSPARTLAPYLSHFPVLCGRTGSLGH